MRSNHHRRAAWLGITALLTIALMLGLSGPATATATHPSAQVSDRTAQLQRVLLDHSDTAPLMIAAHRGQWRTAPENSLAAVDAAIDDGAEIVEIDIQRSADGALVLMHDTTVDRTTNGTGRVADLTLAQLRALRLKEGLGGAQAALTEHRIPTLAETMEVVRDRALVNLDKAWPNREQVYQVLRETSTVKLGLFKSNAVLTEVEPFLAAHPDAHYVHIVDDANVDSIGAFRTRAPVAYEVVFDRFDDRQASPAAIATIRRTSRVWLNSMWNSLTAGLTDEASLRGAELGWARMVTEFDATMIQTDNVKALRYWAQGRDPRSFGAQPARRTVRVQAEDYANGGPGVGYVDIDANRCGHYRPAEDVDVCLSDGALAVNWIRGGEWLRYRFFIPADGEYQLSGRVSTPYAPAGQVVLDFGDGPSSPVAIDNTTSHRAFELQPWQRRTLSRGTHEVIVRFPLGPVQNFNLDYLQFDRVGR